MARRLSASATIAQALVAYHRRHEAGTIHAKQVEQEARMELYRKDPMLWIKERMGENPEDFRWSLREGYENYKWDGDIDPLYQAWQALANNSWAAIVSAKGTGKTYLLSRIVYWFLDCWEDSRVVTIATTENQLQKGLWMEAARSFERFQKVRPHAVRKTLEIRMNDTGWAAYGVTAGVRAGETTSTKLQGIHKEHLLLIIEEMAGVHPQFVNAFKETAQGDHNLILGVGNPSHQGDQLHEFSKLEHVASYRSSAYDHPNVVIGREVIGGAVTQIGISRSASDHGEDSPMFQRFVRGIMPPTGDNALIRAEWFDKALECVATEDLSANALGVDVASSERGDYACFAWGNKNTLIHIDEFKTGDASSLADKAVAEKGLYDVKAENIAIDVVGVGASTIERFRRLRQEGKGQDLHRVFSFVGGMDTQRCTLSVDGTPAYTFTSLRGQAYWKLREDLRLGKINIKLQGGSSKEILTELRREVLSINWSTTGTSIHVESKDDIKKRIGRSTDIADAVIYWNWVRNRFGKELSYTLAEEMKSFDEINQMTKDLNDSFRIY